MRQGIAGLAWASFVPAGRVLRAVGVATLTAVCAARAADDVTALTALDPAFVPGLVKVKRAAGFIEDSPNQTSVAWQPGLQLLVGVKALDGSKRTLYFVQLTTLPPPTNAQGQAWQPTLRTNHWAWSPTNRAQFVSPLYPVRVRVFDEKGQQLKGGQTPMAWGMLTNGLMDLCRIGHDSYGKKGATPKPPSNDGLMLATGGGFLWLFGMFQDLQTVPPVADVWAKAQCAIRWPSAWSIVTAPFRGITIELFPRVEQVTLIDGKSSGSRGTLYRLPLDLQSGKRNLSRVDIVVGPPHGAEMLLAGIRSIRARHPIKPKQEFLAQVLGAGTVRESE